MSNWKYIDLKDLPKEEDTGPVELMMVNGNIVRGEIMSPSEVVLSNGMRTTISSFAAWKVCK